MFLESKSLEAGTVVQMGTALSFAKLLEAEGQVNRDWIKICPQLWVINAKTLTHGRKHIKKQCCGFFIHCQQRHNLLIGGLFKLM